MLRRRGTVYVVVMFASLIVAMMALASIETMRWYARDLSEESDFIRLQIAADAGIEAMMGKLNADPDWRTNHTSNVDSTILGLNGASLRYRLIDADGDLADDELDNCTAILTATTNNASYSWQATLEPWGNALDCLSYAIACDKKLELKRFSMVATDASVASNDEIIIDNDGYLTANCFCTGPMDNAVYGTRTALSEDVVIPDSSVLDYYVNEGTAIPLSALPTSGSTRVIDGQLLSANTNTINGVLDPDGIYVIDCQDTEIRITNSRLKCTLVLVDPKNGSEVRGSVYWEAHLANYPILLTDREIELALRRTPLSEASIGVNFNPAGTPYESVSDSNSTTVYPSQLRGLIYATAKVELVDALGENIVFGAIVTHDDLNATGDLAITYRDIFVNNPPPGFRDSTGLKIVSGSVHRVATP